MRHQQFDELVKRSLNEVAYQLEIAEAKRYLEEDIREMSERNSNFGNIPFDGFFSQTQSFSFSGGGFSFTQTIGPATSPSIQSPSTQTPEMSSPTMPSLQVPRSQPEGGDAVQDKTKSMQQRQLEHYLANKALIDEVIYTMLNTSSTRSLVERIDNAVLADELATELKNNGIDIKFHYVLTTNTGRPIYTCCKDFNPNVLTNTYKQTVFRNDDANRMGVIRVYFPHLMTI